MLGDGFHDIPLGKVATVVTFLEMRAQAAPRPVPTPDGVTVERVDQPALDWYRDLFNRVGGHDWLWSSRLELDDAALSDIVHDTDVHVLQLRKDDQAQGLLELDFRIAGECELAFFGVGPEMIGTGAGRFLMNAAITKAWSHPISRFHVHTCTLDHPAALSFYRRSGFTAIRQQIEIGDDPRLTGLFSETAGPHIPILR